MILRFISGIWTTLAVQWLQVQKHRWVHDGNEIFDNNNTPPQRKANLKLWCGQSKQESETVISWRWLFLVSQAVVSYLWWEWKLVSECWRFLRFNIHISETSVWVAIMSFASLSRLKTSVWCPGIGRFSTSWPPPTPVGKQLCGTWGRTSPSSRSVTTATGLVD